jgi:RNA polymerase sigma factor (sigma-70 family)
MENINLELENDGLLLLRLQQGNRSAFNVLFNKYWEQTYSNAYKRLGDPEQSKDIVQEIFASIWINRQNPINNLPAYLSTSVRNQVFKLAAKNKNLTPFFDFLDNIPAQNENADSNILWKEFYRSYESLLSKLPPKRQQIFRLRFHDDVPTKTIASQMQISRKTVQNQLGKAIEQLRITLLP